MKKRAVHIYINFITVMLLSILSVQYSYATGPGTAWLYVRKVSLSPATPAANYQVKVTLAAGQYGNINASGNDLRFYDINNNACNYWIETWNTAGASTIWVKAPVSGSTSLLMFYGNAAATAGSNGAGTFDFFSDGSSLTGWTNVNATVDNSKGVPLPSLKATANQYAARDIGLTNNKVLEFSCNVISGTTDLCNFYFLANASGAGQIFRLDARGGSDRPGFAAAASWLSWSAPTNSFTGVTANVWHSVKINIKATAADGFIDGAAYGSYNFANNGGYIAVHGDGTGVTGGNFDNIRVRQYTATEPVSSMGAQVTNNIAATISGQTNVFCNGASTGTATVTGTGGSGGYTYSWATTPIQTTQTATGLPAGSFTATVIDNIGLTATATATITEGTIVVASVNGQTNISCFGASDGTITIAGSGGTAPYAYSVNNGLNYTASATNPYVYGGLVANQAYQVRVRDINGCLSKPVQ